MSQLHEDLKAIRLSKKISVEDIFDRTRIAVENIELIEDGSFLSSNQNKTYIRSFARTYARGLGIKDEDMVHALDSMEIGSYQGYLREKYLKGDAPEVVPPVVEEKKEPTEDVPVEKKTESKDVDVEPVTKAPVIPPAPEKPVEVPPKKTSPIKVETESAAAARKVQAKSLEEKAAERRRVNWSETNKKAQSQESSKTLFIATAIIILLLIVIAGAVYFFVLDKSDTDNGSAAETSEVFSGIDVQDEIGIPDGSLLPSDTLDAPIAPSPSRAAASTLPDTLIIKVYAAYGNLEPFRVRSDVFENRRPYWVSRGEAMRIEFVDEISLFNHRDRMVIMYNDRIITGFAEQIPDEQGVTIRRQQFIDDPSLSSFTSSFPGNLAAPRRIIDRPVIIN